MKLIAVVLFMVVSPNVLRGQTDFFQPNLQNASSCGVVMDRSGERIPGASLTLADGSVVRAQAISNKDGSFVFGQAKGVQLKLRAQMAGFFEASGLVLRLRPASVSSCRKPIFVVMGVGSDSYSYLTTSRAEIKKLHKGKDE